MTSPDGCPAAVYARLPAEPELSTVRTFVADRHRVLDLGAGTGRIADPLTADGHDVLAVDESAEMLGYVRRARTVQCPIEDLDLDERFDAVLMLSYLINDSSAASRRAFVASAARHLRPGGLFVAQRHDPTWTYAAGTNRVGAVEVELADVDVSGRPSVSACTVYRLDGEVWRQPWTARLLDDAEITDLLRENRLETISVAAAWVRAEQA